MQPEITFGPLEIWHSMGTVGQLVLSFLLLMSAYSTGIMIERWLLFRRARRQSLRFVQATQRLLAEGKLAEVVTAAGNLPQSHLARLYATAIAGLPPGWETGGCADESADTIRSATERESVLITQEFKKGLPGLASIASTAPFVGLFGTVIGIMNSFFGMAAAGSGGIGAVAGGIAEALVNTAAGILVALPAVWGFNYFLGRLESMSSEMSNASSELVDYFVKRSRNSEWKLEATTGQPIRR